MSREMVHPCVRCVLFLQVCAVAENEFTERARFGCGVGRTDESAASQCGKVPGVVEMCVRQDDVGDARRVNAEWLPVAAAHGAKALERPQSSSVRSAPAACIMRRLPVTVSLALKNLDVVLMSRRGPRFLI